MFIFVNGINKNERVLVNTRYLQAVVDRNGETYLHLKGDVIRIGDSAQKVLLILEQTEERKHKKNNMFLYAETPKKKITLLDAIERATTAGNVAVAFKGYGGGVNAVVVTDTESGEVWRRRYKCGIEEAAAMCIIDALEERKK